MNTRRLLTVLLAMAIVATACGGDDSQNAIADKPVQLRLVTHDSFAVSDDVLADFRRESGIEVKIVESGDAGAALNQAILTKKNPLGDVFFGVDNTFVSRALDAGIFVAHKSRRLDAVDARFKADSRNRVTPIDHGDVCVNYDKKFFAKAGTKAPMSFDDVAAATLKSKFVVENPATSSPGLAFLLATIARFGENGWQGYWRQLRANDVQVTTGWEEAYNQAFSGAAGKGPRPLVVSYASSPPAEVVFADPQPAEAPTGVVEATCFEQIEFAGILRGTKKVEAAGKLIDFMLSDRFQEDMPLQMFVFPVVENAKLPDAFVKHAAVVANPLRLSAADIGRNREKWINEWTAIVLQ